MEKIKIMAIISGFNGGFAYVLNRDIDYTYTKIDGDTIIGEGQLPPSKGGGLPQSH